MAIGDIRVLLDDRGGAPDPAQLATAQGVESGLNRVRARQRTISTFLSTGRGLPKSRTRTGGSTRSTFASLSATSRQPTRSCSRWMATTAAPGRSKRASPTRATDRSSWSGSKGDAQASWSFWGFVVRRSDCLFVILLGSVQAPANAQMSVDFSSVGSSIAGNHDARHPGSLHPVARPSGPAAARPRPA